MIKIQVHLKMLRKTKLKTKFASYDDSKMCVYDIHCLNFPHKYVLCPLPFFKLKTQFKLRFSNKAGNFPALTPFLNIYKQVALH